MWDSGKASHWLDSSPAKKFEMNPAVPSCLGSTYTQVDIAEGSKKIKFGLPYLE